MKKIKEFLTKVIQSDSKESSKRVSAIFALVVAFILSIAFGYNHVVVLVTSWLGFAAGALGMSVYEKIKSNDK